MTAYYNEHDPYAAQWLRNLIAAGHIAKGIVDERSIEDVRPRDLDGFTQCHFFAGVGVWSYALRLAGWRDDQPVWTGSCPCQPFSAAGKGGGFDDERHLWPTWFQLIAQCKPVRVYGEQVASKDGLVWLDLVHTDLENAGYSVGAVDLCAAGVGAPHIRQRAWFVADNQRKRLERQRSGPETTGGRLDTVRSVAACGESGGVGNAHPDASGRNAGTVSTTQGEVIRSGGPETYGLGVAGAMELGGLADSRSGQFPLPQWGAERGNGAATVSVMDDRRRPGPTNGHWRNVDWLYCRDGKWRPVESGAFPLAHGATARVGRLRAYGNAINAQVAEAFIRATLNGGDGAG